MRYFLHESSYVDNGAKIGDGTKIWHFSHISSKSVIGENVSIGQNVFIGDNVIIGDNCKIQNNVSIYDGVILEERVFCGPSCVFTNVINPRSNINRKNEYKRTLIKNDASIGANATIICGNEIGSFSFIAAGATVTKSIPNNSLVAGVPAKLIGWISKLGHRLNKNLECPISNEKYKMIHNDKIELIK